MAAKGAKPCIRCGGTIPTVSRGRVLATKYCGYVCHRLAQQERAVARPEKQPRPCPRCEKPFVPKWMGRTWQKYCSSGCRIRGYAMVAVTCASCGSSFQKRAAYANRSEWHACSVKCRRDFNHGSNHHAYRGDVVHFRGDNWGRLSRETRKRDGHRCRRCGRPKHDGERAFPVDHVIPWRMFTDKDAANADTNLATLCHQCHMRKTAVEERALLRGDWLTFRRYLLDIGLDHIRPGSWV